MAPKNVILAALAALIFPAVCLQAQTRSLIYNATNGEVIANTGTNTLTFTNDVKFGGDMTISGQVISGGGVSFSFEDADFAYGATLVRQGLGFSTNLNTLWAATNASNARSAVGLGETNFASFAGVNISATNGASVFDSNATFSVPVRINTTNGIQFWGVNSNAARIATRANLFPDVTAFTNTSNVSVMRALAGSTNTSEPYSGEITIRDFNDDTHIVSISNGIILNWSTP